MGIYLPAGLPARAVLKRDGVLMLDEQETLRFGIPPLRIALLNLMPNKAVTETQFARLLGAAVEPVSLTLAVPESYRSKTTAASYMQRFYQSWRDLRGQHYDALIVTGAPLETLPFESVYYWRELKEIFDWALDVVPSTLYICWAAQAALYHRYHIPKHALPEKAFGVFGHTIRSAGAPLTRGLGGVLRTPVSRHTEVRAADIPDDAGLETLADSVETGLCLLQGEAGRSVYMFNHLEYDTDTLAQEYARDAAAGKPIRLPRNYYPGDNPANAPVNRWHLDARLFFSNWIGEIEHARYAGAPVAA